MLGPTCLPFVLFAKIRGVADLHTSFLIQKALAGWARIEGSEVDTRHPLNAQLLGRLLPVLHRACASPYEMTLFAAAFTVAFYGAFQVGKLIGSARNDFAGGLQWSDVQLGRDSFTIMLRRSKSDQEGRGALINLRGAPSSHICPITQMGSYLAVRPC